jgi:hypothetical protein
MMAAELFFPFMTAKNKPGNMWKAHIFACFKALSKNSLELEIATKTEYITVFSQLLTQLSK